MVIVKDTRGWRAEFVKIRESGDLSRWSRSRYRNADPDTLGMMPLELAHQYVKLLLADEEKMKAIDAKLAFAEKYRGVYDRDNPPADYPFAWGELIGYLFQWYCYKVDFYSRARSHDRRLETLAHKIWKGEIDSLESTDAIAEFYTEHNPPYFDLQGKMSK